MGFSDAFLKSKRPSLSFNFESPLVVFAGSTTSGVVSSEGFFYTMVAGLGESEGPAGSLGSKLNPSLAILNNSYALFDMS